jgi:hypothetical protein
MMSRHTSLCGWAAAGILSFGIVANAHAVLIPDQVFDAPSSDSFFGVPPSVDLQQGVTAGLSGLLSQIDIFFFDTRPHGKVLFSVKRGEPGNTDANGFQTVLMLDEEEEGPRIEIDVSAGNIVIEPGDLFVIGLQGLGSNGVIPKFTGTLMDDHYSRGELWGNGAPVFIGTSDLNFVTYVGLGPPVPELSLGLLVPEPSGLILLFLGLLGLRLVGMRRN